MLLSITRDRQERVQVWRAHIRTEQQHELLELQTAGDPVPQPDLGLLRKILDQIDTDPECWRQGQWNYCVVGWALHAAGIVRPADPTDPDAWLALGSYVLGLLPVEVRFLADCDNDRIDIDTVARAIAQRAGETL
jgi:hypothetical protein